MRRLCTITALTALTLLSTVAAPAPAGAATVGDQVERRAPSKFPENLVGCRPRCIRGRTIPRGWVLLSRRVRLEGGERRAAVRFTCPGRRRFRTFGHLERGDIFVQVPDSQLPFTRRSRVEVFGDRGIAPLRQEVSGTLYAVCVPR